VPTSKRRSATDMPLRSLSYSDENNCVQIIDQTRLPGEMEIIELRTLEDFCRAISDMQVRGAPLIGITAAYGLALDLAGNPGMDNLSRASSLLAASRPTAVNLAWALERIENVCNIADQADRFTVALGEAHAIAEEDVANCRAIGDHGLQLLQAMSETGDGRAINILTHCNAGWLAALEWGTALAPIYRAHGEGIPLHVWVSETRPRNQGAKLTAWELAQAGIPHTLVADGAAGYLMQTGRVDCCIVGSDRTAANGDVCNKIGTYPKALAAKASGIPFYVALPLSTFDWSCSSGAGIPVEERDPEELLTCVGRDPTGDTIKVLVANAGSPGFNPAFDITPAELVTGLITECGIVAAEPAALRALRTKIQAS
jgi:methylthioribose-1-phosphate isomerase